MFARESIHQLVTEARHDMHLERRFRAKCRPKMARMDVLRHIALRQRGDGESFGGRRFLELLHRIRAAHGSTQELHRLGTRLLDPDERIAT